MKMISNTLSEQIKSVIRSSKLYQKLYNKIHAKKLAASGKRLDICASEVAIYLLLCGKSKYVLRDSICLEIGSGWLLTHALVFYLLGAKKVYASDVEQLFTPEYIAEAIRQSVDWSILDSLSTFEDRSMIKSRLNKLLSIPKFSLPVLQDLGIEYIAPIDLSRRSLNQEKINFIFSKSVLEHVPVDDIVRLLENLVSNLAEDGFMFHLIHLVDHRDINGSPFDFFKYSKEFYSRELQTRWGNRVRQNQWKQIFSSLKNLDSKFLFEWSCFEDKSLPAKIDASIQYLDERDLRVSHLGVFGHKVSI